MSIDNNLLIAAQILHDECKKHASCDCCQMRNICDRADTHTPEAWIIPDPPPEPTEQQRIEWLRMLPDDEMLDAVIFVYESRIDCIAGGPIDWWHKVVTLEKFRKDVGLDETDRKANKSC